MELAFALYLRQPPASMDFMYGCWHGGGRAANLTADVGFAWQGEPMSIDEVEGMGTQAEPWQLCSPGTRGPQAGGGRAQRPKQPDPRNLSDGEWHRAS